MVRRGSRSGKKSDHRRLIGLSISGTRGSSSKRGTSPGRGPAKRSGALVVLVLGALVLVNLYVFVWDKKTSVGAIKEQAAHASPAMTIADHPLENLSGDVHTVDGHPVEHPHPGAGLDAAAPRPAAPTPAPAAPAAPLPPGTTQGKVAKSDTLGRLLKKNGLSGAETDEVIRSLSGVLDFKAIRAGQVFRIERGPEGRVHAFELVVNKTQTVRSERNDKGVLVGTSIKPT